MLVTGHTSRQTHSAAADPFAKFDGQGERWKIRFDFFAREECVGQLLMEKMSKCSHLSKSYFMLPSHSHSLFNDSHQIEGSNLPSPLLQNHCWNTHTAINNGFVKQSPGTKLIYIDTPETCVLYVVLHYHLCDFHFHTAVTRISGGVRSQSLWNN